ncbi:hypothetical protein HK101_009673, partial [Irineochytrium annulatum]
RIFLLGELVADALWFVSQALLVWFIAVAQLNFRRHLREIVEPSGAGMAAVSSLGRSESDGYGGDGVVLATFEGVVTTGSSGGSRSSDLVSALRGGIVTLRWLGLGVGLLMVYDIALAVILLIFGEPSWYYYLTLMFAFS